MYTKGFSGEKINETQECEAKLLKVIEDVGDRHYLQLGFPPVRGCTKQAKSNQILIQTLICIGQGYLSKEKIIQVT